MTKPYSQAELQTFAIILRQPPARRRRTQGEPRAKLGAAILGAVLLTLAGSQLAASTLSHPAQVIQTARR